MPRGKFDSTNQKHYPDPGSDASLPLQGFLPEGEIPRRHSSNLARISRKVLTAKIYCHTVNIEKNLDLLEQGPRGIGR